MKCQHCKSKIDDEIEIDEWYNCPLCGMPMFGFRDDMLDIGVDTLIHDIRLIEKRLFFLTSRLNRINEDKKITEQSEEPLWNGMKYISTIAYRCNRCKTLHPTPEAANKCYDSHGKDSHGKLSQVGIESTWSSGR